MKNKYKNLDYILGALYSIILILIFIYYFLHGIFENQLIIGFSSILFIICYNIIPFFLIFLPTIIESVFNKNFITSIILSSFVTILYLVLIIPTMQLCIKSHFSTFTTKKWTNMIQSYRYLMIDDLQEKYNFVGMDKEEVFTILGEEDVNTDLVIEYYLGNVDNRVITYNIYLDKNEVVIKTEVNSFVYE